MIYFKEDRMREEFLKLGREIKDIMYVIDALMKALYGFKLTVTSIFREDKGSTHGYYRAVDIRSAGMGVGRCLYLETIINLIFPYGRDHYKTMLYHDAGSGWHFHLQVKE